MAVSPLVSIIVLNYNGIHYIGDCLTSILDTDYPNFEVLFIDNASNDGSPQYVEKNFVDHRMRIVIHEQNFGFAEGNNRGVKYAQGEFIALLNNDTKVTRSWLTELIKIMKRDPQIGVAQSKLLRMDNPKLFDTCGHMLTQFGFTIERGVGEVDNGQYDYIANILGAKGAAMIIRRKLIEEIGLFDPDYFALREETDLCLRVWLRGYRVVFIPKSLVYHDIGGVLKKTLPSDPFTHHWRKAQLYYWHRNGLITLIKNLEYVSILRILPTHIFLGLINGLFESVKSEDTHSLISLLRGLKWIMINLKTIWFKRKAIKQVRLKRDNEIMPKIMLKTTILTKIRERNRIKM